MKSVVRIFTVIFLIILFTGCLKVETTVNVNKDGSGTIEETFLLSRSFADMLAEFSRNFEQEEAQQEFSIFNEDELINSAIKYGDGVKYVSGEKISDAKWEGFKATYSFTNLERIKLSPDPDSKTVGGFDEEEAPEAKEYYYFKFVKGDVPKVIIDRPDFNPDFTEDENWEDEAEDTSEEMDEQFVEMLEGMSINISMNFNGTIVETNANYVDGSKITLLSIDVGELLKDKQNLELFKKKQPKSIDELKEMVEKVPGMKLEFQKPVTVNFK